MPLTPFTIGAASAVGNLAISSVRAATETTSSFASALSSAVQSAGDAGPQSKALGGEGSLLSHFYQDLTGRPESSGNEPIKIEDVRAHSLRLLTDFRQRVQGLLKSAGIDVSQDIRLTQDATGAIRVAGDHPQKAEIENLLAQDPELSDDFSRLSGMLSLVQAADAHSEFAQVYDRDPKTALAQYAHLLDDDQEESTLEILLGEFDAIAESF